MHLKDATFSLLYYCSIRGDPTLSDLLCDSFKVCFFSLDDVRTVPPEPIS